MHFTNHKFGIRIFISNRFITAVIKICNYVQNDCDCMIFIEFAASFKNRYSEETLWWDASELTESFFWKFSVHHLLCPCLCTLLKSVNYEISYFTNYWIKCICFKISDRNFPTTGVSFITLPDDERSVSRNVAKRKLSKLLGPWHDKLSYHYGKHWIDKS